MKSDFSGGCALNYIIIILIDMKDFENDNNSTVRLTLLALHV